jgi:hypothetical protein
VFLLARDPPALAEWYRHHLGWELGYLADENAYYVELYFSKLDRPEQHQHLVFAIMPGDPGEPGQRQVIKSTMSTQSSLACTRMAWRPRP